MKIASAFPFILTLATALLSSQSTQAGGKDGTSLNPLTGVEKTSLKAFIERPLFSPRRRRPPAPVSPLVAVRAPTLDEPPPPMHLLGVIRGIRDIAIVRRSGEKKTTIVRSGDYLDKWVVTVVPPLGVRLSNAARTFEYTLFTSLNKNAAPTALAPSPVGAGTVDAVGMPTVMPSSWGMSTH